MHVERQNFRGVVEQRQIERQRLLVVLKCRRVFKIANMLRDQRLTILEQTEGAFELATQRQERRARSKPAGSGSGAGAYVWHDGSFAVRRR